MKCSRKAVLEWMASCADAVAVLAVRNCVLGGLWLLGEECTL